MHTPYIAVELLPLVRFSSPDNDFPPSRPLLWPFPFHIHFYFFAPLPTLSFIILDFFFTSFVVEDLEAKLMFTLIPDVFFLIFLFQIFFYNIVEVFPFLFFMNFSKNNVNLH